MNIKRKTIKDKLTLKMNRIPKESEITNAFQDANLMNEIILDEIDEIKSILKRNNIQ